MLSKKPILLIFVGVLVVAYLVAGFYTELQLVAAKPLPALLLEDFVHYERALRDAQSSVGAYAVRQIGPGYLYPPPSLFLIEAFQFIQSPILKAAVYSALNVALLALIVVAVLQRFGGSSLITGYWLTLSLTAAPFLEILHIGQINVITLFGIALTFLYQNRSATLSGLGLALAVLTKLSPVVLFAYVVAIRRFRVALVAIGVITSALVLSEVRYPGSTVEYMRTVQWLSERFPLGMNSHSFVSKMHALGASLKGEDAVQPLALVLMNKRLTHLMINLLPMAVLAGVSLGLLMWKQGAAEPSLAILLLGMTLSPNVMWYHHYVFLTLPLLLWLGWRRFDWRVATWCTLGMMLIQVDRFHLSHGLLVHLFGRLTMLLVLHDQLRALGLTALPCPMRQRERPRLTQT